MYLAFGRKVEVLVVVLDVAVVDDDEPVPVAGGRDSRGSPPALAFGLGRKCPGHGELRFPRFVIGRLVLGEKLDLVSYSSHGPRQPQSPPDQLSAWPAVHPYLAVQQESGPDNGMFLLQRQ